MNKARRNKRRKEKARKDYPDRMARLLGYADWQSAYRIEGRDLSRTLAGTEILMHMRILDAP